MVKFCVRHKIFYAYVFLLRSPRWYSIQIHVVKIVCTPLGAVDSIMHARCTREKKTADVEDEKNRQAWVIFGALSSHLTMWSSKSLFCAAFSRSWRRRTERHFTRLLPGLFLFRWWKRKVKVKKPSFFFSKLENFSLFRLVFEGSPRPSSLAALLRFNRNRFQRDEELDSSFPPLSRKCLNMLWLRFFEEAK